MTLVAFARLLLKYLKIYLYFQRFFEDFNPRLHRRQQEAPNTSCASVIYFISSKTERRTLVQLQLTKLCSSIMSSLKKKMISLILSPFYFRFYIKKRPQTEGNDICKKEPKEKSNAITDIITEKSKEAIQTNGNVVTWIKNNQEARNQ